MATFETCEECGSIINTDADEYVFDDENYLFYHQYCVEKELPSWMETPISTRYEHVFHNLSTSPWNEDD